MQGHGPCRLGRRVATALTADDAKEAPSGWLEGCVWAMAYACGLDWGRMRYAVAADVLRKQPGGWQDAVARAVGGADADSTAV